jgi:uncharacterized protein
MSGATDLSRLLQNMKPQLNPGQFVFCCLPHDADCQSRSHVCTSAKA